MSDKALGKRLLGYLLLASALIVYLALFSLSKAENYLGLINSARMTGTYGEFCSMITYTGECSTSLIYTWVLSRIPVMLLPALQLFIVILLYFITYRISRSHVASGLVSFTYALIPGVLYNHYLDQTGLYASSAILSLAMLFVLAGFIGGLEYRFLLPGVILYAFMLFHPFSPIVLCVIGVLALVGYFVEIDYKRIVPLLVATLSLSILAVLYNGLDSYSSLMIPSMTLVAGAIVLLSIARDKALSYRASACLIVIISSLVSAILVYSIKGLTVIQPPYLNPLFMYGIVGLLTAPSIILVLVNSSGKQERSLLAVVAGLLLTSVIEPSIYLLAAPVFAVFSVVLYERILSIARHVSITESKLSTRLLALIPIISIISSSLIAPFVVLSNIETKLNPFDELAALSEDKGIKGSIDISSIANELVKAVAESSDTRDVLLVLDWRYSDFIQGLMALQGVKARVLAFSNSRVEDKSLLSRVFTGDWRVSRLTLLNISEAFGVKEVYLVVSFAYASKANSSYIGVPVEYTPQGQTYPSLFFEAYGDIYLLLYYLYYSNRSINDYIVFPYSLQGIATPRMLALSWSSQAENTLLAQLCIKALEEKGYKNIYNYMVRGMTYSPSVEGFDIVYLKNIELGSVSLTYYGDFTVNYMIAVFKLSSQSG